MSNGRVKNKIMPNKIDVFDQYNHLTGQTSTITEAIQNKLWKRGVHITIVTETGYVLIQKRSASIKTHPGMLDISCGGFVDAGEDPETAAVRETAEEMGLRITKDQLVAIKTKRQKAWPLVNAADQSFLYNYAVVLPDHLIDVSNVQPEEVEWAKFISLKQAKRLTRFHRQRQLGRLKPNYKLLRQSLDFASQLTGKLTKAPATAADISITN